MKAAPGEQAPLLSNGSLPAPRARGRLAAMTCHAPRSLPLFALLAVVGACEVEPAADKDTGVGGGGGSDTASDSAADTADSGADTADSGADTGDTADSGADTDTAVDTGAEGDLLATEILGRPTDHSVDVSVVPGADLEAYVEYGTSPGTYTAHTAAQAHLAAEPFEATLDGLAADTRYYYRLRWRVGGAGSFSGGPERTFHTARGPGASFVFTIQADAHLDDKSSLELYQQALGDQAADAPDFMIDLGDTFMCEKHCTPFIAEREEVTDYPTVAARYLFERGNFGLVAHSAPLFLVNGNHEGESGWLLDGTADNVAVWTTTARKSYYPVPEADTFYSTTEVEEEFVGARDSWYAWTWGDALFIVLDPFWYTTSRSKADGWAWTLGEEQYRWLQQTLEDSDASLRFVFVHHLVGGLDSLGRGGVEAAPYYEWGGLSDDGTDGFAANRPGWDKPIHELLVDNHVTAVFHGHDHVYVRQELDGIVYQELAQPSATNFNNAETLAEEGHYASGVVNGSSGYLRVSVGPSAATAEYVRAYRSSDENGDRHNGDVDDTYTLTPR